MYEDNRWGDELAVGRVSESHMMAQRSGNKRHVGIGPESCPQCIADTPFIANHATPVDREWAQKHLSPKQFKRMYK